MNKGRLKQDTAVGMGSHTRNPNPTYYVTVPKGTRVTLDVSNDMSNLWCTWHDGDGYQRGKLNVILPYALQYDFSQIIETNDEVKL